MRRLVCRINDCVACICVFRRPTSARLCVWWRDSGVICRMTSGGNTSAKHLAAGPPVDVRLTPASMSANQCNNRGFLNTAYTLRNRCCKRLPQPIATTCCSDVALCIRSVQPVVVIVAATIAPCIRYVTSSLRRSNRCCNYCNNPLHTVFPL